MGLFAFVIAVIGIACAVNIFFQRRECEEHSLRGTASFEFTGELPREYQRHSPPRPQEFILRMSVCATCEEVVYVCTTRAPYGNFFKACHEDLAFLAAPPEIHAEIARAEARLKGETEKTAD